MIQFKSDFKGFKSLTNIKLIASDIGNDFADYDNAQKALAFHQKYGE
jgi:hypothetical protein